MTGPISLSLGVLVAACRLSSDVHFTAPLRKIVCVNGFLYVLGHSMQDVTDEDEEQSRGQHSTMWDALSEGPLFAQMLFYLGFGFPVVHELSSSSCILPATPHWHNFNFRPSFHTLSKAFSRSIYTVCVCFLSWKTSSIDGEALVFFQVGFLKAGHIDVFLVQSFC